MTPKEVRNLLMEWLRNELLGPAGGEEELLEAPPVSHYLCGMLAPKNSQIVPEENEDSETEESETDDASDYGDIIPLGNALNPSSIGLSVLTESTPQKIQAHAKWGRYTKISEKERKPGEKGSWRRRPFLWTITIDLNGKDSRGGLECPDDPGVRLEWLAQSQAGQLALSIFIVNAKTVPGAIHRNDEHWLFQPEIELQGADKTAFPFLAKRPRGQRADADSATNDILYRNRLEFATGHGVSVDWERTDLPRQRAGMTKTVIIPAFEVPNLIPSVSETINLSMRDLAECPDQKKLNDMLSPLPDEYAKWIESVDLRIPSLPSDSRPIAKKNIALARETVERIRAGIEVLKNDARAFQAFQFANQAMVLQRAHTEWAAHYKKTGKRDTPPELNGAWRPFQMAFILLSIAGIVDPLRADRGLTDLLWFPTGGGKTEAYLGITAFTLAFRRLRGKLEGMRADAGVSVLMRYTLRMLTIQQFQRAASLMCACDLLRQKNISDFQDEPFRIGLWVGRDTTPNSFLESKEAISSLKNGESPRAGNPMQLTSCPWCGEKLTHTEWKTDELKQRTLVGCSRKECEFSFENSGGGGLPVVVVDEEIYRQVPSVLLATVDKFARLPWVGKAQSLFGIVKDHCSRHGFIAHAEDHSESHRETGRSRRDFTYPTDPLLPPELIIQDELHLISGPLGTLVALYETAIDWLCSFKKDGHIIRPKVVASTATIRRAPEQVRSLFNRDIRIFPPPVLDAEDSYFARESPLDEKPGRLFVGISAPGKSMKTALLRVYALLLVAAEVQRRVDAPSADPYMTLVGYFNSLRELGGALRLVQDDVRSRIMFLVKRLNIQPKYIDNPVELTSNVDAIEIPLVLSKLENSFGVPGVPGPRPVDVLLASNMISVGVDINRLGLMVVAGQPKTTSEYIQSTSRVGRQFPGLIVTVYKWSRPRDLSHYESFKSYHSSLYRHVEAISVTPFSSRARDRGLHGILTAMCRLRLPNLSKDLDASRFSKEDGGVKDVIRAILDRVKELEPSRPDLLEAVEDEIRALADDWAKNAAGGNLRYAWQSPYKKDPPSGSIMLLRPAESEDQGIWKTPNSLRDVEVGAHLYIPRIEKK